MTYFWMSAEDERADNFILYRKSRDATVALRDRYVDFQCQKCRKVDELRAINSGIDADVVIRSKFDWVATLDGLICISREAIGLINEKNIQGLHVIEIPGTAEYAIAMPATYVPVDGDKNWMDFRRPCPVCKRFRETLYFPPVASMTLPSDAMTIVCPDVVMEGYKTRKFWFLASQDVVRVFQVGKISGVDFTRAS